MGETYRTTHAGGGGLGAHPPTLDLSRRTDAGLT